MSKKCRVGSLKIPLAHLEEIMLLCIAWIIQCIVVINFNV